MYSYIFTLVQLISYRIRYILLKILLKTNNFKKELQNEFQSINQKIGTKSHWSGKTNQRISYEKEAKIQGIRVST